MDTKTRFTETAANIEKLRNIAELSNTLHEYVYLREDSMGRYIEYAFIDGAPRNNRCLSWYSKLHPKALERNGRDVSKTRVHELNRIYKLKRFTCSDTCIVGSPADKCVRSGVAQNWTYEEPVKCACWDLCILYNTIDVTIEIDD